MVPPPASRSEPSPEPGAHMTPEEFRRWGHAVVDWLAAYRGRVEELPVLSQLRPGDVRASLPAAAAGARRAFRALLADVDRVILPGITHWQSPNFFAYFPANASGPSILGELLSAGLGVQGMLWVTSPACTELETHVLDWLVEMLGLPGRFQVERRRRRRDPGHRVERGAVRAPGGARARDLRPPNRSGCDGKLVAYASDRDPLVGREGHQDRWRRRARTCGWSESTATSRCAPTPWRGKSMPTAPPACVPFFVCATVGTTSSKAIDPVRAIGEICRSAGCGSTSTPRWQAPPRSAPSCAASTTASSSPTATASTRTSGCSPTSTATCLLGADRRALIDALSILPDYLRNRASDSGAVIDYRDWHVPLGRRFRSLKLWFVIRHYGVEGLRRHVREHVAAGAGDAAWVEQDQRFELAAPTPLNLVCFRLRSGDAANQSLLERLNASGELYLTSTRARRQAHAAHVDRPDLDRAAPRRGGVEEDPRHRGRARDGLVTGCGRALDRRGGLISSVFTPLRSRR